MRKTMRSKNVSIGVVVLVAFIMLITLTIGNIGTPHQEVKTLNYGKITFIADDNNTFSDLSRNMTMQTGS
jgi:hypothetical protein